MSKANLQTLSQTIIRFCEWFVSEFCKMFSKLDIRHESIVTLESSQDCRGIFCKSGPAEKSQHAQVRNESRTECPEYYRFHLLIISHKRWTSLKSSSSAELQCSCSRNELVGNWLQHDRLVELGANKVPRVRLLRLPAHKHSHQTTQFTALHQHTNYRLHTTPHQPTNNYYTARQKKGIIFVLCASLSWQKDGDFFHIH